MGQGDSIIFNHLTTCGLSRTYPFICLSYNHVVAFLISLIKPKAAVVLLIDLFVRKFMIVITFATL